MPENHAPNENIPIALRLIPLMTGWSSQELLEATTQEICEQILLAVYDWKSEQIQELVPPNRFLPYLKNCPSDASIEELIETIPTNLFVWSADLDTAHHNYYTFTKTEPPGLYSLSPDWSPNISQFQSLFCDCPNEIMKLLQKDNQTAAKSKTKTDVRNSALHIRAVRIYKNAPQPKPNKEELCEILTGLWNKELPDNAKPLSPATIMREIEFKKIEAAAEKK